MRILAPFLPSFDVDVEVGDPDDVPVIAIAIAGSAEVIVTGGGDVLDDGEPRSWLADRRIEVMSPTELLDLGIEVGGTAAPTVVDNEARNSGAVGILFGEQAGGAATGNVVTQLLGSAVQVGGTSHPDLTANVLRGGRFGVVYVDGAAGAATDNRIVDNEVGIR